MTRPLLTALLLAAQFAWVVAAPLYVCTAKSGAVCLDLGNTACRGCPAEHLTPGCEGCDDEGCHAHRHACSTDFGADGAALGGHPCCDCTHRPLAKGEARQSEVTPPRVIRGCDFPSFHAPALVAGWNEIHGTRRLRDYSGLAEIRPFAPADNASVVLRC